MSPLGKERIQTSSGPFKETMIARDTKCHFRWVCLHVDLMKEVDEIRCAGAISLECGDHSRAEEAKTHDMSLNSSQ